MHEIEKFILATVKENPQNITKITVEKFGVSRQLVVRYLSRMIEKGLLVKKGTTKNTVYYLASGDYFSFKYKLVSYLEETVIWQKEIAPLLKNLPKNVYNLCNYGFTEMFNNVIDHSEGTQVIVDVKFSDGNLSLRITDDGIGIFKKIMNNFQLSSLRESILHLTKGKFTTDPKRHTGEGIFFTSRAFDEFLISSDGLAFVRFDEDDWLIEKRKKEKNGTSICLTIKINSEKNLTDIFRKYTDSETYNFDKTTALVELSKNQDETYISRSQAKRLLLGLEKFERIVFDFKGVSSVGQGFVDQVFRIFKMEHPAIEISSINTNEDVDFMIKRGVKN